MGPCLTKQRRHPAPNCGQCGKKFGVITRSHECRRCGKPHCSGCSHKRSVPAGSSQRVCTSCVTTIDAAGTAGPDSWSPSGGPAFTYAASPSGWTRGRTRTSAPPAPAARAAAAATPANCPHCHHSLDPVFADSHIQTCVLRLKSEKAAEAPSDAGSAEEHAGLGRRKSSIKLGREPVTCEHCNELIHPALMVGHRTHCRPPGESPAPPDRTADLAAENANLCIICFESKRTIAFVPCGHWTCCSLCTVKVTQCPVCRSDIDKRVIVEHSVQMTVCSVCCVHIHPTFYDGHREVCRMRMKTAQKEKEASRQQEEATLLQTRDSSDDDDIDVDNDGRAEDGATATATATATTAAPAETADENPLTPSPRASAASAGADAAAAAASSSRPGSPESGGRGGGGGGGGGGG
eukprot:Rhum_TRINITY_DN15024_c4_g3::Rhum_TRINITY_DN15024_c4_g3_i1::g.133807::m.133807